MFRFIYNNFLVTKKNRAKQILNDGAYSSHLNLISEKDVFQFILEKKPKKVLDVGGRNGEFSFLFPQAVACNGYDILDVDVQPRRGFIRGDIIHCPEISSNSYELVFSNNVLEHVADPFAAGRECVRICRPSGLNVHLTPFSWRYHPCPKDFFRFTHSGLEILFNQTGDMKTLQLGYDISRRRQNHYGGKLKDNLDTPPIDAMGGWLEQWQTIYIGEKK
ncbi:class I SAM-dependent methyltransferase [Desulfovibrio sp. QI0430]